ncbi:hypothetical protein BpHYR1_004123 [Brachionus plicatilis]|uniref:Integrase p58-like C-terminal domain-containing protein n=1 Tax=Brachionus plicatilis TaxID=10195 RepID=A0A3M7R1Q6_BRAPC|nr:hypothetical protein BpHYR1_004123 [Brachionus plicatilis]
MEGDLVMLSNNRQKVGQVRSFVPKFMGPFKVTSILSDVNFEVRDVKTGKKQIVHYNWMTRYVSRDHAKMMENISLDSGSEWRENKKTIAIYRKKKNQVRPESEQAGREETRPENETIIIPQLETIAQENSEGESNPEGAHSEEGIIEKTMSGTPEKTKGPVGAVKENYSCMCDFVTSTAGALGSHKRIHKKGVKPLKEQGSNEKLTKTQT